MRSRNPTASKPSFSSRGGDAGAAVEPLGEEAVRDHATLDLHDDLAGDQAIAVGGERALPADQRAAVEPFPGLLLEILAQPVAVDEVEGKPPAGPQQPSGVAQQRRVILGAGEIAEGIAEDDGAVELARLAAGPAAIALEEFDREISVAGAAAGEIEEVVREIDAGDVLEAAARQLQGMPALAAAEVEHAIAGLEGDGVDHGLDVGAGVVVVLEDVAVGLEIEIVEDRPPPVRPHMRLEIGDAARRALEVQHGGAARGLRRARAQRPPRKSPGWVRLDGYGHRQTPRTRGTGVAQTTPRTRQLMAKKAQVLSQ